MTNPTSNPNNRLTTTQHQQQSSLSNDNLTQKKHMTSHNTDTNLPSAQNVAAPSYTDTGNIMPTVGYNYERIRYKNLTITMLDFSGQNRYRNLWQEFYNCVDAIVFVIDSSDLIRFVVARDELEVMLSHSYFNSLCGQQSNLTTNDDDDDGVSRTTATRATKLRQIRSGSSNELQKQLVISRGKLVQQPLDNNNTSFATTSTYSQIHFGKPARCRTKVPILFLANKCDLANAVDTEVLAKVLNLNKLSVNRHPWLVQATSVNTLQGIQEGFDWLINQLSTVDSI